MNPSSDLELSNFNPMDYIRLSPQCDKDSGATQTKFANFLTCN